MEPNLYSLLKILEYDFCLLSIYFKSIFFNSIVLMNLNEQSITIERREDSMFFLFINYRLAYEIL